VTALSQPQPTVSPTTGNRVHPLDAGRHGLAFLGVLSGCTSTCEAMADPLLRAYVSVLLAQEVVPLVPPTDDLVERMQALVSTLADPRESVPLAALTDHASTTVPVVLLPLLRQAADRRHPYELLALAVAAWLHGLRQPGASGLVDARATELRTLLLQGGEDPRPVLMLTDVFGDIGHRALVGRTLRRQLHGFAADGWRATLMTSLAGTA
jgi:mannitol-1-phosphate/altronate dehydrogenase